ncbi:MAG: AsmA family protein [Polaromonas sp.]
MRNPVSAWKGGTRWSLLLLGVLVMMVVGVGIGEAIGWPFLVSSAQSWLSKTLDRRVDFGPEAGRANGQTRIGLIGSIRVQAPRIEIAAPAWSQMPHTMLAHDASLTLGYLDLWRAWRGEPLHIRLLEAGELDLQLERTADGRATWQFGKAPKAEPSDKPTTLPSFGSLRVRSGHLTFADTLAPAEIDARFALSDGRGNGLASVQSAASAAASAPSVSTSSSQAASGIAIRAGGKANDAGAAASAPVTLAPGEAGLKLQATGSYRKLPVRIDLRTTGVFDLLAEGKDAVAQPVRLVASVGRADLSFTGSTTDPLHFTGLRGSFSLAGPSLAAVGDPLGITLPATPAFRTQGKLVKDDTLWKAVIDDARIGSSRLNGAFTYDTRRKVPLLAGRLGGSRLLLSDLGPAVGAPAGGDAGAKVTQGAGRVIPDRAFDLPSLRKMDANVVVDIAELNTGTEVIEQLRPLRAHLLLADGILTLSDIEARTAKGRLLGYLQLDGRGKQAKWTADLRLLSVDLARWLKLERGTNKPPYLSGKLDAQVKVAGSGRSTAEILASLDGDIRMHMRDAAISHLVVEAAGIDLAEALGIVFRGDDALPIICNVADFGVAQGVIRPKVFIVNTRDSTIWLDGTASLRTETLDVRAIVSPKDFSPLTLRTPVHVRGTFSKPSVSLELGKLAGRAGAAGLLALLNPLAALIPFIDPGADNEAKQAGTECATLVRSQSRIAKPVLQPSTTRVPAPSPAR